MDLPRRPGVSGTGRRGDRARSRVAAGDACHAGRASLGGEVPSPSRARLALRRRRTRVEDRPADERPLPELPTTRLAACSPRRSRAHRGSGPRAHWVISDEAYEDVVYDGARHVSIAALPGMYERTVPCARSARRTPRPRARRYLAVRDETPPGPPAETPLPHDEQRLVDLAARAIGALEVRSRRRRLSRRTAGAADLFYAGVARPPARVQRRTAHRRVLRVF